MSVTDAQFRDLLRGQGRGELLLLCEIDFAYQTASGPAIGTIYLSDGRYRTKEGEAPSLTRYHDVIVQAPGFSRSIDLATLGGRWTMSQGSMKLVNLDGEMDFLLDAIIDGREARFYVGQGGDNPWPRADFRQVNAAVVVAASGVDGESEGSVTVTLRDKSYLLDDTVVGEELVTGPAPGKPKPILLGVVNNFDITPCLVTPATLTYKINDFGLRSDAALFTYDLRDGGLSLIEDTLFFFSAATLTANLGTDTLTWSGGPDTDLQVDDVILFKNGTTIFTGLAKDTQYWIIAAGLTPTDFRVSLTRGGAAVDITGGAITGSWWVERRRFYVDASTAKLTLSSQPVYSAKLDMRVIDSAGAMKDGTPHQIFEYLLANYSKLSASEYDTDAMDDLHALEIADEIRGSFAILDRRNLLEILDEIAISSQSWYGWTSAGVLTVGKVDLANLDSATPVATILAGEIDGDVSCENLKLPWGRVTVDYNPNASVQQDGFSPLVEDEFRAIYTKPFQTRQACTDPAGTTYTANWWDYHKSAIDSKPIGLALGQDPADGIFAPLTVADAIRDLFAPWTRAYRLTVGADYYALNPGDCVSISYPRFGLDDGKNMRVISVTPRLADRRCDLVLVRREIPDYTTASHP